ncbi:uncharacterized protein LOC127258417 isoform X1 [Andrographis paniculata]|uniref:uncharacterized protein LOC127258417 isoform X1 n=1 Tax=Andrographis paniculata TaxID=175694 RepID=UPI0021E948CE|nr:uncharacterized protein LOC127258417 isoform X1 [Andrographis paniculata]
MQITLLRPKTNYHSPSINRQASFKIFKRKLRGETYILKMHYMDHYKSTSRQTSRRQKRVKEKTWTASFEIFKHDLGDENYILEMNISSDEYEKIVYHVFVVRKGEKLDIGVKKMSQQHTQNPSRDIINPPLEPAYNLFLQERLEGWELQIKKLNNSSFTDKVYDSTIHYICNIDFFELIMSYKNCYFLRQYYIHLQDSFTERVALSMLYGCEMKHLSEKERTSKKIRVGDLFMALAFEQYNSRSIHIY